MGQGRMLSTAVEWANRNNGVFSMKYRGGDAYDHFDVPGEVYLQYLATTSKGQFINWVIKPNYRYQTRTHH